MVEQELYKFDKEVRKRPFPVANVAGDTPIPSIRVDFAESRARILTLSILGVEEKDYSCRRMETLRLPTIAPTTRPPSVGPFLHNLPGTVNMI
ncbi:hypothetical protein TTRE_0000689801 [Trichuris trichiura]|uniref:Uncharacterized protein n=1 Tax=Trichuris trichiura TaxID=36087 RepID=A0A077ZDX7_TRITR|nr:hypothetical protein TTRE_0000689801 [Trichuris trichiura]